jgi:hypothetical protein
MTLVLPAGAIPAMGLAVFVTHGVVHVVMMIAVVAASAGHTCCAAPRYAVPDDGLRRCVVIAASFSCA